MNPQQTVNYMGATAKVEETERRAARNWQAAQARAAQPQTDERSRSRIVGTLFAVLAAVGGLVR